MSTGGKCVILSAPSGAGKTTIARHLLREVPGLEFSVSATSRERRVHEVDGRDYHFITAKQFQERIAEAAFIEWEEVYAGQYYGTLKSELERIWNADHHAVFDVDVVGGSHLKEIFGARSLALFISPPSLSVLEDRLRARGTETAESLQRRLEKATREMAYAPHFDAVVVNDDLARACRDVEHRVRQFLAA